MKKSEEAAWHRGYKIGYEDAGIHHEMAQDKCRRISINKRIFDIMATTPYTAKEINDFMMLSGCNIDKTEKLMKLFINAGINNLSDINTVVKLGLFVDPGDVPNYCH